MRAAAPVLGHAVLAAGLLAANVAAFAPFGWAPTPRVHLHHVFSSPPDGPWASQRPNNRPPARTALLAVRKRLATDGLFNGEPLDLNESVLTIESIVACQAAVVSLLKRAARREALGVDVLHARGNISLISVATESGKPVVVFDIHRLQGQAFQAPSAGGGGLGFLLESPSVDKIVFGAGPGADALSLQFGVRLENAWDVQELYSNITKSPSPAWAPVLSEFLRLTEANSTVSEQLKGIDEKGFELLWPGNTSGGEIWTQRPIQQSVLEYTVARARFLPDMWDYFNYINEIVLPVERENQTDFINKILKPLRRQRSAPKWTWARLLEDLFP